MTAKKLFILIHGAWHASWCWQGVAKQLRLQGHTVLTPDLPGHGSKTCPANTITFNDYVLSIIHLVKLQSEPVILVGHSMGGLIISSVADIIPDYICQLIFVAAYVPKNRESLLSIAKNSESRNISSLLIIDAVKQEIRLKYTPELATIFFNCCDAKNTDYAMAKLQAQPLQPFTEKISVGEQFNRIAKRSLICKHDRVLLMSDQLRMSKLVTEDIIYLDADHSPYYSAETDLVHALNKPCVHAAQGL